jgi:erythromycin esterase-like protein
VTSRVERASPRAIEAIRAAALPLEGDASDLDPLVERLGAARFVLLGESTHGTHEAYRERARITQRLVEEKGFRAVAIEGDWPDAFRVNRFVRGHGADREPADALGDFARFPRWMWRNADALDLVSWIRTWNDGKPEAQRVGFYGLDLYALHHSIEAILRYLDEVDPDAARRARERYSCFERFGDDPKRYGKATSHGDAEPCEEPALRQLLEMQRRRGELQARDGRFAPDEHFHAMQSSRIVAKGERYYRAMFRGEVESWNLRDEHMVDTLAALAEHLATTGPSPVRIVVWAHNSHVGDARATELGERGEWNLGELARKRFGADAVLVGLTTHHGTVTAAHDWDGPALRRTLRPAIEGSYASLFHATDIPRFLLFPRPDAHPPLPVGPLLERAVGVVYRPESERESHYFEAHLAKQFDALLYLDETRALVPLDPSPEWASVHPDDVEPASTRHEAT